MPEAGSRSSRVAVLAALSNTHSSRPCVPSSAVKNVLVPSVTKFAGLLLPGPGLMSATRPVPAAVPSVEYSSVPPLVAWLSVATKYRNAMAHLPSLAAASPLARHT